MKTFVKFSTLILAVLFMYSCDLQEFDTLTTQEKTKKNYEPECILNPESYLGHNQGIEWFYGCRDEPKGNSSGDCGSLRGVQAHVILKDYLNCKIPDVGINQNQEVCGSIDDYIDYREASFLDPAIGSCSSGGGPANPASTYHAFEYMDFGSNCNVSAQELEELGDFLYQKILDDAPIGYIPSKVFEIHTDWMSVDYMQNVNLNNCNYTGSTVYPCGSSWWNSSPNCSLGKTYCERRSIKVYTQYKKICNIVMTPEPCNGCEG